MFWVIVMFIALFRLPWRSLEEACHLTGRYSWTGADYVTWQVLGPTEMLWEFWRGRSPHGLGSWSLITGVSLLLSQAGVIDWLGWQASIFLHTGTSSLLRSDLTPTVWSRHRGNSRLLPPTVPLPPGPNFCGSWRGKSFLFWILAGWKEAWDSHSANCRPAAKTLDLEWMTEGWRTVCWQQWPWWAETELKQPYIDWAVAGWGSDPGPSKSGSP